MRYLLTILAVLAFSGAAMADEVGYSVEYDYALFGTDGLPLIADSAIVIFVNNTDDWMYDVWVEITYHGTCTLQMNLSWDAPNHDNPWYGIEYCDSRLYNTSDNVAGVDVLGDDWGISYATTTLLPGSGNVGKFGPTCFMDTTPHDQSDDLWTRTDHTWALAPHSRFVAANRFEGDGSLAASPSTGEVSIDGVIVPISDADPMPQLAVPEPATVGMFIIGGLALMRKRWHKKQ